MMTADKKTVGLYIHIPFCRSKCPYCDFYSFFPRPETIDRYVDKICADIANLPLGFDTVYLGGGTPSFIGEDRIASIIESAKAVKNAEITVECNPSDTGNAERAFDFSRLKDAGVNRISMGLQSAVNTERKALGRRAGRDEVSRAVERCYKAGIDNVSLDLMLGIPGQTEESISESIDFCISSGAKHISAYILKIEEETYFSRNKEKLNLPSDDETADLYLLTAEKLKSAGFGHYEISNFALPGYESRHNLKYWHCEEYLGLGPAAHSFIDGRRFYYEKDVEKYISGCLPVDDGDGGNEREYIMLTLRLSEGIVFQKYAGKLDNILGEGFIKRCRFYADSGFGTLTESGFSLNEKGFLISNSIISDLVDYL
ncbi:MAG: radical SAM family heme chaperone HemW [Clostridia bacterium]|nr:radical SAM family heme chaperone HemW [Clostridia bacterium]